MSAVIAKVTLVLLLVACAAEGTTTTTSTIPTTTAPPLQQVPYVVGSDEAFARGLIVGAGLAVEVSNEIISGDPGVVVQQIPSAGSMVESTTIVTLVVPIATTTTTSRVTTTTLDMDGEIVERLRRLDNEVSESLGYSTFVGLLTDRQLIASVDSICGEMRSKGVSQAWTDKVGELESPQDLVDMAATTGLFTIAVQTTCDDLTSEWYPFLEGLQAQLEGLSSSLAALSV